MILYTGNIGGDLALLPRLHTFLRQLKAHPPAADEDEVMLCLVEPVPTRTLLLDVGGSCAADVWHCAVTGGRSALIGLDAMGYTAANVEGTLTDEGRAKLADNYLNLALVDETHFWADQDILVSVNPAAQTTPSLHILLMPNQTTYLDNRILHLAAVQAGQVGMAQISGVGNGSLRLTAQAVFDVPAAAPPDPTITAAVEFILNEARYLQRRGT